MVDVELLRAPLQASHDALHAIMDQASVAFGHTKMIASVGITPVSWNHDHTPVQPQSTRTVLIVDPPTTAHAKLHHASAHHAYQQRLGDAGMIFINAAHALLPMFQGPSSILQWSWRTHTTHQVLLCINGCWCNPFPLHGQQGDDPPFTAFAQALAKLHAHGPATQAYTINHGPAYARSIVEACDVYETVGPASRDPHLPIKAKKAG